MKTKLKSIMLIDDSAADNFLHTRVIRKAEVAEEVLSYADARKALAYLKEKIDDVYAQPDMIFLDINMPGMNGWEFLNEYSALPEECKADVVICMLTTSFAKEDRSKAEEYNLAKGYTHKPLTQEKLMEVLKEYHPDLF
jgi:CheY-like chemotaxis protein